MISCSRFDGQLRESPLSRTYVDQLRICQTYLDTLSPSNTYGDLLGNPAPSLLAESDVDLSALLPIPEIRPPTVRRYAEVDVD
ncbi:unnamed protein product [Linum trigynum]|uniref:Uncharacterized protein n=1 Tax=Linum trigynum TaxID=586398 RepID=A0AAV2GCB2_9ROSI